MSSRRVPAPGQPAWAPRREEGGHGQVAGRPCGGGEQVMSAVTLTRRRRNFPVHVDQFHGLRSGRVPRALPALWVLPCPVNPRSPE